MERSRLSTAARRLGSILEPVVGQVYFSPECHANYEALGFDASTRKANGVALPDGPAYFTSRGSVMGQVPGEVVAAAFAVFNPAVVVPSVTLGWTKTDAPTICTARDDGAIAQLQRLLGEAPDRVDRAKATLGSSGRATAGGRTSPLCRCQFAPPCPTPLSARCGGWATCCASTAATRTRRRGSRPASTQPRSAC